MIKLRFERGFNNDPLDTPPTQFQFGLDQAPVQAVNTPNEQIKGADGSIRLRRKCEQGTACATDHPFGGASEKQIE